MLKELFSLSYNLSLSWQVLTFGKIFIYCNKKDNAGLGEILQIKKADFSALLKSSLITKIFSY
jgi:hypothetical protein